MNKMIFTIMLISLVSFMGCKKNNQSLSIGLFDISKDDKNILFSMSKNGRISILSIDLDGANLKPIVKSTADSNYYNPSFNKDGSKILFIGSNRNNKLGCSMFLANKDGSQKHEILKDDGEIIEAIFSSCEEKIYYIKSKEFGSFSPVGRSQPHNSDLYAISLIDYKIEQITSMSSYDMFRLSEFGCENISLTMSSNERKGLLMFSKRDPKNIIEFNPLNNPRKDNSLYNTPFYSEKYNLVGFIAPYELYIMDINKRIAKLVLYEDDMIKYFRFLNNHKEIVYTSQTNTSFHVVNFEGFKIGEIDLGSMVN